MGLSKWKFGGGGKHADNSTIPPTLSTLAMRQVPPDDTGSSRGSRNRMPPSPLSWLRSSLRSKRKSLISRDDPAFARLHKPFTPQNLEHQKLLGAFEWHFYNDSPAGGDDRGDDRRSQQQQRRRRPSLISSRSPFDSRSPSFDGYPRAFGDGRHPADHMPLPHGS
ncbi:hypothetical protein F4861DRAFT_126561 [Xylaria intraflava]|nr:hypothetical protein F4861DRAFT_126561 [Xylaria intraflava]